MTYKKKILVVMSCYNLKLLGLQFADPLSMVSNYFGNVSYMLLKYLYYCLFIFDLQVDDIYLAH